MADRRYWNPELETMPLDKLKKLQTKRLRRVVKYAYNRTSLYRRKFDEAGVRPGDINTLDDLGKLPLTRYWEDFCNIPLPEKLAVPIEEVKEVFSTSGTVSGFTQPVLRTRREARIMYDAFARAMWALGVRPDDVVQDMIGFDVPFTSLGAAVVLAGTGRRNLDHQIRLARLMNVTTLYSLPSLALEYLERAKELGINLKETKLRLVVTAGEALSQAYRKKIEEEYGLFVRAVYGSSETGLVSVECRESEEGMHTFLDLCVVEVIDPETDEVLGLGEEGELVVTCLTNEAMPLIRYRTGDVASFHPYEPCRCGRSHPKISMIKGRVSEVIRVRGKRLFPVDVEQVLVGIPGLGTEYQIILTKEREQEKLKVKIEVRPETGDLAALTSQVDETFRHNLGIESEIDLVPSGSIKRTSFKAERLIVRRREGL